MLDTAGWRCRSMVFVEIELFQPHYRPPSSDAMMARSVRTLRGHIGFQRVQDQDVLSAKRVLRLTLSVADTAPGPKNEQDEQ